MRALVAAQALSWLSSPAAPAAVVLVLLKLFSVIAPLFAVVSSICVIKAPKAALRAQAVDKTKRASMPKSQPQQYRPPSGRIKDVSKISVDEQAKGRVCVFVFVPIPEPGARNPPLGQKSVM